MNPPVISRRAFVGGTLATVGSANLAACGGGEDALDAASVPAAVDERQYAQALATVTAPSRAKVITKVIGANVTSLRLVASTAGTFPYSATVLPLQGQVPVGWVLTSSDDVSLRSCVVSRWNDGSAAVVVVSSSSSFDGAGERKLPLQASLLSSVETALSSSAIGSLVKSVKVDFGSLGVLELTDFAVPERIWWANPRTICARYRGRVPGHATLAAVVDIQAFSGGRALVEVVVENALMVTATPVKPARASYTAQVWVNGAAVATVQSAGAPEGSHAAFRAWYASKWVGGDTALRATQDHLDLQQHPLLFKCDQSSSVDMAFYAADAYAPWSNGRHRPNSMGTGGDWPAIGPLPQWEARALQTGDYRAWQAVEASALAVLSYNVNYRDSTTGLPPTFDQLAGKSMQYNWPSEWDGYGPKKWEVAHHGAAGLMAFAARPSPVFIEIAQKVAVYNGTWSTFGDDGQPQVSTGVFGPAYQLRGRAWGLRSLAHATFLTPDAMPWRTAALTILAQNFKFMNAWRVDPKDQLNAMWENRVGNPTSVYSSVPRANIPGWQHHYLTTEVHKIATAQLLKGDDQLLATNVADWCALQPVRWINEQANGGWRYLPYVTILGRAGEAPPAMTQFPDWGSQRANWMQDAPVSPRGPWCSTGSETINSYAQFSVDGGTVGYPWYFWSALVAAVERGVPGAAKAWSKVQADVTNLSSWRAGFAGDPRWGSVPKAIPAAQGFALGTETGTLVGDVWTPARTDGVVNQASWDIVPKGRWIEVAGTRLDGLNAQIIAANLGWSEATLAMHAVMNAWNGFAIDSDGCRVWLAAAGGHADSSNNGVYEFNAFKMAWSVRRMPSDRNKWSSQYKTLSAPQAGTFTHCRESATATPQAAPGEVAARGDSTRRYFYDQLYWDARPTSRHVYSSVVYAPETNELICGCRSIWKFSLDTNDWTYNRSYPKPVDGAEILGIYDEVTREYLFSGMADGVYASIGYKIDTNTWTSWGAPWVRYGVADCRHGRTVTVFNPPFADRNSETFYWSYDLNTRRIVAQDRVQLGGGLAFSQFQSTSAGTDGMGITYVAPINRYWILYQMVGGMRWLELDPTTTPWTLKPLNFPTGNPPVNSRPGRKVVFMPGLNAVIMSTHSDRGFFVYRF